jgi:hypothetical protein
MSFPRVNVRCLSWASTSAKKDLHSPGGCSICRIRQLVGCDAGQNTPMCGGGGTVCHEPSALGLRHRVATQRSFGSQAGLFKLVFPFGQNLNRSGLLQCPRGLPCEMNKVTQPVLRVLQFRPVPQPFPVSNPYTSSEPTAKLPPDGCQGHASKRR